jgi:hypothetical protein
VIVVCLVFGLVALLPVTRARRKNTQNRQLGAGEQCFFLFPVEGVVHLGRRAINLHSASYDEVARGNSAFNGTTLPLIPVTS